MLTLIISGFFAGFAARILAPGRFPMGLILTTLLGIGGAVFAKYLGLYLGLYRASQSASWVMSVLGAVLLLVIYAFFQERR